MMGIDLHDKKFLVMGVANKRSLGWAIADRLHAAGAQLAFSYQAERLQDELEKLTAEQPDRLLFQCDVSREEELARMFAEIREPITITDDLPGHQLLTPPHIENTNVRPKSRSVPLHLSE